MGATWDPALARPRVLPQPRRAQRDRLELGTSPVQDLARDNRWGRPYETWAEEPVLAEATLQAARESITLLRNQGNTGAPPIGRRLGGLRAPPSGTPHGPRSLTDRAA